MARGYKVDKNGNFGLGTTGGYGVNEQGDMGIDKSEGTLGDLADVDLTGIATDNVLKYNGNTKKWVPGTGGGGAGGSSTLEGLTDVNTTNKTTTNTALQWDSVTSRYAFKPMPTGGGGSSTFVGLTDVDTANKTTANTALQWDSATSKYAFKTLPGGGGGSSTFVGLTDVDTANKATANTALQWDAGTSKYAFKLMPSAVGGVTNWVDVTKHGAAGDGIVDDSTAIETAIAACSFGSLLYFPPQNGNTKGYRVTRTINVPGGISVTLHAPLIFDGTGANLNVPALVIGNQTSETTGMRFEIWTQRKTQSDFTNENSIGVKFINVASCDIQIRMIQGFTIGYQMMGWSAGCNFNEIHMGHLLNNKIGVDVTNKGSRLNGIGTIYDGTWVDPVTDVNKFMYIPDHSGFFSDKPAPKVYVDGVERTTGWQAVYFLGVAFDVNPTGVVTFDYTDFGWVNDNLFFGRGYVGNYTDVNQGVEKIGIRFSSMDAAAGGSYYYNDGNTFYKPVLEMTSSSSALNVPIKIEYGHRNSFHDCRCETGPAAQYFAIVQNDSYENYFDVGFTGNQNEDILDQSKYGTNWYRNRTMRMLYEDPGTLVFDSGPLHKNIVPYGVGTYSISPVALFDSSVSVLAGANYITPAADHVLLNDSGGIGCFVDTRVKKKFVLKRDVIMPSGGRVYVKCYDAAGAPLSTTDPGTNLLVRSLAIHHMGWNSDFGGSYKTFIDTDEDTYFNIASNVASIAVFMVAGSTADLKLRRFQIFGQGKGGASAWTGLEQFGDGRIATQVPTTGTFPRGFTLKNVQPTIIGTAPNRYIVAGWTRVTAGSGNVLNTDWVEMRTHIE